AIVAHVAWYNHAGPRRSQWGRAEKSMTRTWRDFDFFLLSCVIVLTGFSLALVYSTTLRDPATHGYLSRHLANLIVGFTCMVLLAALDSQAPRAWAGPLYLGAVAVLAWVRGLGHSRSGAQSGLALPLRTIQPSELAKPLIIVALAAYWAGYEKA